jgi:hypothetical protein
VRILFDQGVPKPLLRGLTGHEVETAFARGWQEFENGELLDAAEADGFDLVVTTDKNWRYQQNIPGRQVAIIVLWTTSWPKLRGDLNTVRLAIEAIKPGQYVELVKSI